MWKQRYRKPSATSTNLSMTVQQNAQKSTIQNNSKTRKTVFLLRGPIIWAKSMTSSKTSWLEWDHLIQLHLFYYILSFIFYQVKLIYGAKYSFCPSLNVKSSSFMNRRGYSTACPTKLPLPSLNFRMLLALAKLWTSAATVTLSSGMQPNTYL